MQRGQFPYTQDRAKTQNQTAHYREAGHCCFKVLTSAPCCEVNSARILLNSAVATCGEICLDADSGISSSSVASGTPGPVIYTQDANHFRGKSTCRSGHLCLVNEPTHLRIMRLNHDDEKNRSTEGFTTLTLSLRKKAFVMSFRLWRSKRICRGRLNARWRSKSYHRCVLPSSWERAGAR
jgi:hypothetical protein